MYTIRAGNKLIYSPTLLNQDRVVVDPVLNIEVNKAPTLSFVVPRKNDRQGFLSLLKPEVRVYDGDVCIFRGRVLTKEKDFQVSATVDCEGDLAYLRDAVLRIVPEGTKTALAYFEELIGYYNGVVEAERQFSYYPADLEFPAGATVEVGTDQYPDIMSEITDKFLNKFGGFISTYTEVKNGTEYRLIKYVQEPDNHPDIYGNTASSKKQMIKYGRNLLDFSESADGTPIYTRIIPLGAVPEAPEQEEPEEGEEGEEGEESGGEQPEPPKPEHRLTILGEPLAGIPADARANGHDYINAPQAYIDAYGIIEHVETYDEINDSAQRLYNAGKATLDEAIAANPTSNIELTAVDMSFFEGGVNRMVVGRTYRIYFPAHGYTTADKTGRLNRAEIKLDRFDDTRYYFGNAKATLSQEAVSTNHAMDQVTKLAVSNSGDITKLQKQIEKLESSIAGIVTPQDYITEEGALSGGSWLYRKWNNNITEYVCAAIEVELEEVSTGVYWDNGGSGDLWTALAYIDLPEEMNGVSSQVTLYNSSAISYSIEHTSTQIGVHLSVYSLADPGISTLNFNVYLFRFS